MTDWLIPVRALSPTLVNSKSGLDRFPPHLLQERSRKHSGIMTDWLIDWFLHITGRGCCTLHWVITGSFPCSIGRQSDTVWPNTAMGWMRIWEMMFSTSLWSTLQYWLRCTRCWQDMWMPHVVARLTVTPSMFHNHAEAPIQQGRFTVLVWQKD